MSAYLSNSSLRLWTIHLTEKWLSAEKLCILTIVKNDLFIPSPFHATKTVGGSILKMHASEVMNKTFLFQVLDAKNLAKKDIFGASDPYVRIDLVSVFCPKNNLSLKLLFQFFI